MELIIPLNSQENVPLYEQIYQYIRNEIRTGNLASGRKIPSSRELAKSLKVSRSTAQLALEQLASEGYLDVFPRRGYFVAGLDGVLGVGEIGVSGGVEENWTETPETAASKKGVSPWEVDFSPRGIDLESFPYSTWQKVSRGVLKEENKELFLKGTPQGDLELREEIRDYLHRARGVVCGAEQIVVGAGSEYLLMILSLLLGNETGIAMENPTYEQAYRVLSAMGHQIFPLEMDGSGFQTERLSALAEPALAAYVTPSHQFPMGIVMPMKRRQELLSWASAHPRRYIIEDDYDSEFRYRGKPIPALQGTDRSGRVIYMGTFSKSLAPAIRIGYMVLPPDLLCQYEKTAGFYSSTVSRVDQRILTRFMAGGYYERHLNRMRAIYKEKHDVLLGALRHLETDFQISGEFAGLHILFTHKGKRTEEELVRTAGEAGVRVYGLSDFYIDGKPRTDTRTVILGYANLSKAEILRGAALLSQIWGN